ncbi:MAG: insulinase family protein [Bacteroidales bacterium]|nr:insulinase family protein [Bacteroidales bacterium]
MKKPVLLILVLGILLSVSCTFEKYKVTTLKDKNGYLYTTVKGDPIKTRIYTLDNGLKAYLTINKDAPRINTLIGVRAGGAYDPAETTGLAHYLEHMMFKGTDEYGTSDWEQESKLIAQISDLFEQHRSTDDPIEKKKIYHKIDSVSGIAATFAIANEYNKMTNTIGAKNTNAFTGDELTAYMNDIPSNQLEKWLQMEKERFSDLVLRLFHTELETVYEEFNMSQDRDGRKVQFAMNSGMFEKHPYGTQTVLGKGEHLKNPSMVNIHNYFDTYYVPNNMAMCMSGDLDFEETIQLIDKHWGDFEKNKDLPKRDLPKEDPILNPVVKEVVGPDAESIQMGFRFDGANSMDEKYVTLIDMILSNSKAGLIDLDLVQEQKVISAGSYTDFLIDYGKHIFHGNPRQGQSLEEVKKLLLTEIEKVKNGEFEDWLLKAVVNDLRLSEIRQAEGNGRAFKFLDAFIKDVEWKDAVSFIDDLEKITKEELVEFAKNNYKDNYVVVYKRNGKDSTAMKIDKPVITKVDLNRDMESDFYKNFLTIETGKLDPVFVDFKEEIKLEKIGADIDYSYLKNESNELFKLAYIIDMGKDHMKQLPIAVNFLPFLGTDKYSPAELQQEFFKLGISLGVWTSDERSYVFISGLQKSFDQGLELIEHVLANVKPDQQAYDDYVKGILKKRSDAKLNKNNILWSGLMNYGKFGPHSSFTDILSDKELKELKPEALTDLLKKITSYKHQIFYYGPNQMATVKTKIEKAHITPETLLDYPAPVEYAEKTMSQTEVFFVDYDMVQANFITLSKGNSFDKSIMTDARLFNEYFSTIVFQEIREARGLAYSAGSSFVIPSKKDRSNFIFSFVATQADKLGTASDALQGLFSEVPQAAVQFNSAKDAILTKIETERITKDGVFWTYLNNKDRGIDYDYRKDVYENVKEANIDKFVEFFNKETKDQNYNFLVIADRDAIDMETLKKIGPVTELTLEELFGY